MNQQDSTEPGTREHKATLAPGRVDAWLNDLERRYGVVTGMSQDGAPGGKVRVTATTRSRTTGR